tara:strand:+ start:507 stop:1364 length:858 start_codon:yes stop_codon:yes gene_type:complete
MSKYTIYVVIYNYKSSNLLDSVRSVYENVSDKANVHMYIYDQHPLNRKDKFSGFPNLEYEHVFWDHQYTPINYKKKEALSNVHPYTMLMSADISLDKDWDLALVDQLGAHKDSIISGQGKVNLKIHDKYFVRNAYPQFSDSFLLSNYIDRNLVFSTRDTLARVEFPTHMKYWGEEEMMSVDSFVKDIRIYSCPLGYYTDNHERNLERLYSPFSIEHNYNAFLDYINDSHGPLQSKVAQFFEYHNIDPSKIKRIPYQVDDVLYDPNSMNIVGIGGERFIDGVNTIA